MDRDMQRLTLSDLESLLSAFGADPSRWPSDRRDAARALLAQSPEARRLLDEARAIDRLLSLADRHVPPGRAISALGDRIVAQAAADGPMPTAEIVALPVRRRPLTAEPRASAGPLSRATERPGANRDWRPAAALAASLLLGFAIGLGDVVPGSSLAIAGLTQSTGNETEAGLAGWSIDALSLADEDLL